MLIVYLQIADLELELKLQKEEMELKFGQEKTRLLERFEEEKAEMKEIHRMKILDYEAMFSMVDFAYYILKITCIVLESWNSSSFR